jgi:hypothetical protein
MHAIDESCGEAVPIPWPMAPLDNQCVPPGRHGSICWSRRDGSQSSIAFEMELHAIKLAYTWTDLGLDKYIPFPSVWTWSFCRFGCRRAYFLCPGCTTTRRCSFRQGGSFRCCACARVAYASQNEGQWNAQLDGQVKSDIVSGPVPA